MEKEEFQRMVNFLVYIQTLYLQQHAKNLYPYNPQIYPSSIKNVSLFKRILLSKDVDFLIRLRQRLTRKTIEQLQMFDDLDESKKSQCLKSLVSEINMLIKHDNFLSPEFGYKDLKFTSHSEIPIQNRYIFDSYFAKAVKKMRYNPKNATASIQSPRCCAY